MDWTVEVDAGAGLSLLVVEDAVIVSGRGRPVVAHAATTGEVLWTDDEASVAPAADEGRVFVASGTQLRALDARTGDSQWTADVGMSILGPQTWTGLVVAVTDTEVVALRAADGTTLWRRPVNGIDQAIIGQGYLVMALEGPPAELVSIAATTGDEAWRAPLYDMPGPMVEAHGALLFGSASGTFYAYWLGNGKMAWYYEMRVSTVGQPAADEHRAYVALINNSVVAFDLGIGNRRWSRSIDERPASGLTLQAGQLLMPAPNGVLVQMPAGGGGAVQRLDALSADGTSVFEAIAVAPGTGRLYVLTTSSLTAELALTALRSVDSAG